MTYFTTRRITIFSMIVAVIIGIVQIYDPINNDESDDLKSFSICDPEKTKENWSNNCKFAMEFILIQKNWIIFSSDDKRVLSSPFSGLGATYWISFEHRKITHNATDAYGSIIVYNLDNFSADYFDKHAFLIHNPLKKKVHVIDIQKTLTDNNQYHFTYKYELDKKLYMCDSTQLKTVSLLYQIQTCEYPNSPSYKKINEEIKNFWKSFRI